MQGKIRNTPEKWKFYKDVSQKVNIIIIANLAALFSAWQ
jgi:hypothetical protein